METFFDDGSGVKWGRGGLCRNTFNRYDTIFLYYFILLGIRFDLFYSPLSSGFANGFSYFLGVLFSFFSFNY